MAKNKTPKPLDWRTILSENLDRLEGETCELLNGRHDQEVIQRMRLFGDDVLQHIAIARDHIAQDDMAFVACVAMRVQHMHDNLRFVSGHYQAALNKRGGKLEEWSCKREKLCIRDEKIRELAKAIICELEGAGRRLNKSAVVRAVSKKMQEDDFIKEMQEAGVGKIDLSDRQLKNTIWPTKNTPD